MAPFCSDRVDGVDPLVVANAMLVIIGRALSMLKSQIEALGRAFIDSVLASAALAHVGQADGASSCEMRPAPLRATQQRKTLACATA